MTTRPNTDKVICGVLEDDCRLPEEKSSKKERDNIFVFARETIDHAEVENSEQLLHLSTLWYPLKRSFFREFGSAHAASEKIMSHSKSPR